MTRLRYRSPIAVPLSILGAVAIGLACAQPPIVIDSITHPEIVVDGAYEDWNGRFTRIDGRRSVGLGIGSGDGNLYICLVSRDFGVQTLLRRAGFTLWLDPHGGQERTLGLRIAPVQPGEGEASETTTPRVEIVRDGAEYGYQLAEPGPDATVDAKTSQHSDVVVYEFRVALDVPLTGRGEAPLASSRPPDGKIGLGVVTEPLEPAGEGREGRRRGDIAPLRAWAIGALSSN